MPSSTYPIFGIGVHNFPTYSGIWHDVHMTYLQVAAEGGIPVLIIYLMFFRRGFKNLKVLRKRTDLDPNITLFVGALHSSLVGFVVGACFAPEAYQFFPYFAVAFIATLLQTLKERDAERRSAPAVPPPTKPTSFPGGLCRLRKNEQSAQSAPVPLICRQFCAA